MGHDAHHILNAVIADDLTAVQQRVICENAPAVTVYSARIGQDVTKIMKVIIFDDILAEAHREINCMIWLIVDMIVGHDIAVGI